MNDDVEEMDRMIGGYLAFARGEGEEQAQPVLLEELLEEIAGGARRAGADIQVEVPRDLSVRLRRDAARRRVGEPGGQCAAARARGAADRRGICARHMGHRG